MKKSNRLFYILTMLAVWTVVPAFAGDSQTINRNDLKGIDLKSILKAREEGLALSKANMRQ